MNSLQKNKVDPQMVELAATALNKFVSPAVETCYRNVVANNEKNPMASNLWFLLGAFLTISKFSNKQN